jgi:2-polyprenyl-3-methyl-5-hydroxy-6-metoxy-1,4-benzoquinol methylase
MVQKVKSFVQRKLSGYPFLYRAAKACYIWLISKPYSVFRLKMCMPTGSYHAWYEENADFSHHTTDIKAIAFHLPQFHQIPENDLWWGEGFTEWTNTKKTQPLFYGHYQPREPHDDIGYYDLSDVETLRRQTSLARQHGIYGFCFHHYWFSGKRLLEKPLDLLLENPDIAINFCLCWANENWTRRWDGKDRELLIEQKYEEHDPLNFIKDLEKYLKDKRYIRVNGKPMLLIYKVPEIPNIKKTIETWRQYCRKSGIGEIAVFAILHGLIDPDALIKEAVFDGFVEFPPHRCFTQIPLSYQENQIYDYAKALETSQNEEFPAKYYRAVMCGWDNTARLGGRSTIFNNFSIKAYYAYLKQYINYTRRHFKEDNRFVFINAWNEWAEGTYLEPDKKYGYTLLNMTSKALFGLPHNDMVYNPEYKDIRRQIDTNSNCSYALINAAIKSKSEILEFGPASGYYTRYLAEEKKAVVDIVELSQEYAEKACVYARDCVVGDIEEYDWLEKFGHRKYDHIVFADVLEHLKSPWEVLEKAMILLKEHGSIIISLPNIAHNAVLATLCMEDFSYRDYGVLDRTHLRFFTENTARKMIKDVGLRVKDTKYVYSADPAFIGMDYDMTNMPKEMTAILQKRKTSNVVQFVFVCQ